MKKQLQRLLDHAESVALNVGYWLLTVFILASLAWISALFAVAVASKKAWQWFVRIPAWPAWLLTGAWIVGALVIAQRVYDPASPLGPNGWGDFMGGFIAAPLAFFWLIYELWQQRKEIESNTVALSNQEKELANQVVALNQHAAATRSLVEQMRVEAELLRYQNRPILVQDGASPAPSVHGECWRYEIRIQNVGGPFEPLRYEHNDDIDKITLSPVGYFTRDRKGTLTIWAKPKPPFFFTLHLRDDSGYERLQQYEAKGKYVIQQLSDREL